MIRASKSESQGRRRPAAAAAALGMAQPPAYNAAPVQGQVLQASVAPSPAAA
eukprot:COSAG04_NODE_954_length_9193_cov_9.021113_1_plen_51_part_10